MDFSERLKELRKSSDFSQRELAHRLGISVSAYQYYEQGKNEPTLKNLIRLANEFGVTLDYLVGRSDQ